MPEPESWVWVDEKPTVDQMLAKLKSLPDVFGIKAVDFADFVLPLSQKQNIAEKGQPKQYVETTRMYMTVAGRAMMLYTAAKLNNWKVVEDWDIINPNPVVFRCKISISWIGDLYDGKREHLHLGIRSGVSKAKGDEHAWEKMETAARGRAIAAWGFGVFPGSGIASFEEMEEVTAEPARRGDTRKNRKRDEIMKDLLAVSEDLRMKLGHDPAEWDQMVVDHVADRLHLELVKTPQGVDFAPLEEGNLLRVEQSMKLRLQQEENRDLST